MFEDLYDWAGEFRTINISKKGTGFYHTDQLETTAKSCFKRLQDNNLFADLSREDYIDALADFYCVTNMLHPLREGNGRPKEFLFHS